MTQKTCVVVGGGVVGLLAAYLASKNYDKVILIERSTHLGGLLGSFERNGAIYDYGTHVPAFTGIDELDDALYGTASERQAQYHFLPYLRSENFFSGKWNTTSPLIDSRSLPSEDYTQGILALLEAPGADPENDNLYQYLINTFGETFTEKIYRPVMKKLLHTELENIHKVVLKTFGLQRLIALTPEVTRDLKTLKNYDASLGFHSYTEGSPGIPYCYPKGNKGISHWPETLLAKIKNAGVSVMTGVFVQHIHQTDAQIQSLTLNDGTSIICDHVLWTVPPALALKAANLPLNTAPPVFRTHTLCHYQFRDPFLKSFPQYLLCWDSSMLSYRITLYPNISEDRRATGCHNLTVEVLSDATAEAKIQEISNTVLGELRTMQVVGHDNPLIDSQVNFLGHSFPVVTKEFLDNAKYLQERVELAFSNITLLGRGAGATFFINDLLIETYHKVRHLDSHHG